MVSILNRTKPSLLASAIFGVLLVLCTGRDVLAVAYNVTATIPYDPPTQAATFDSGFDGSVVHDSLLTLHGTCQLMSPQTVVAIWRNGTAIGSAPCTGNYAIHVILIEGANQLIARTANASNLYGPDSLPIAITLVLPVTPPPATPTTNPEPATPAQEIIATNAGTREHLTLATTEPYSMLSKTNDVTISVVVGGGEHPYDIVLNWGDGSVDTHHVDSAGTYSFSHQYQATGSYTVHGRVRDVLGAFTEFDHAVLTAYKAPATTAIKPTGTAAGNTGLTWHSVRPAVTVGGAAVVLGGAYWLGLHHAAAQMLSQAQTRARSPLKPQNSRKPRARIRRK